MGGLHVQRVQIVRPFLLAVILRRIPVIFRGLLGLLRGKIAILRSVGILRGIGIRGGVGILRRVRLLGRICILRGISVLSRAESPRRLLLLPGRKSALISQWIASLKC